MKPTLCSLLLVSCVVFSGCQDPAEIRREKNKESLMNYQSISDEITAIELAKMLHTSRKIVLVDVREQEEWNGGHIAGARLLPLSELPARFKELPKNEPIVLYCRGGGRSMQALEFLREKGYTNLRSVRGGFTAWTAEVDPKATK